MRLENEHYTYVNNQEIRDEFVKYKDLKKKFVLYIPKDNFLLTFDGEEFVKDVRLKYDDLSKSKVYIYKKFNPYEKGNCDEETRQELLNLRKDLKENSNEAFRRRPQAELDGRGVGGGYPPELERELLRMEKEAMADYYYNFMNDCKEIKAFTMNQLKEQGFKNEEYREKSCVNMEKHSYDMKNCILYHFWRRTKTYQFEPGWSGKWVVGEYQKSRIIVCGQGVSRRLQCL